MFLTTITLWLMVHRTERKKIHRWQKAGRKSRQFENRITHLPACLFSNHSADKDTGKTYITKKHYSLWEERGVKNIRIPFPPLPSCPRLPLPVAFLLVPAEPALLSLIFFVSSPFFYRLWLAFSSTPRWYQVLLRRSHQARCSHHCQYSLPQCSGEPHKKNPKWYQCSNIFGRVDQRCWNTDITSDRSQRSHFGDTTYGLTILAAPSLQGVACPPPFPNRRDGIQSIHVLIVWPKLIDSLDDLVNGDWASRIEWEVRWRLDLDKQQRVVKMLDNESNEVGGFFRFWNIPMGTDIVSFRRREPIV